MSALPPPLEAPPGIAEIHESTGGAPGGVAWPRVYLVARPDAGAEARARALAAIAGARPGAACLFLPALPRARDGRVDEAALPPVSATRPPLERDYVAPRYAAEAGVARAWEAALGFAPVGVDDDWFELGGASLQAFALVAGLNHALGTTLRPRDLFDAPTVAAMARTLRARAPAAAHGGRG